MATIVSWNGSSFTVPATGEENWGGATKVDGLLASLATNGFQKSGGLFTLSADADFGASAGLKAIYYKSRGTVSTAGILRLAKTEAVAWRNNADGGNNTLATDTSDQLLYNGVVIVGATGITPVAAGGTGFASYTIGDILYASGTTALSKLGIGTADHLMYSTGAAPAYRLLLNASVSATAQIARSKLADGSVDHVLINSAAGVMTSEATLSPVRGGTGVANNAAATLTRSGNHAVTLTTTNTTSLTLPTTGTLITLAGVEALTNKTFSDPITMAHVATPSNPAAGNAKVYVKSDNLLYILTPAGLEQTVQAASEKTAAGELTNLALAGTVGSNALTIALKTKAGTDATASDIVKIGFRNATAATGTYQQRSVTAALSTVISSGSTGGFVSAQTEFLYIYAIDNAGTVELAWSTSRIWDENTVQTTTAEGGAGAADDRYTLYSTTARSNVAIRLIGRMKFSLTTAGTWNEVPDEVSCVRRGPLAFRSEVVLQQANGHGSTNTAIRRFTTAEVNAGSALTYADSAGNGGSITVNEHGIYEISYTGDNYNAGAAQGGVSVNSAQLTTAIVSITAANRVMGQNIPTSTGCGISCAVRLIPGDVIRAHTDGQLNATTVVKFRMVKLSD